MKEPVPAKGNAVAATRETVARPTPAATDVRVVAKFYRRMKPQRVFPLVVELQGTAGGSGGPVFIHPFIPGAHVIPAEQSLDPAAAKSKATFYVTPHAKGALRGARLDVFQQGRLVQEIPLAMRTATQRLTWVLALLTVLVPAFLLYFTVYHPLKGYKFATRAVPLEAPPAGEPEKLNQPPKEDGGPAKGKDGGLAEAEEEAEDDPSAATLVQNRGGSQKKEPSDAQKPRGGRGGAPPGDVVPLNYRLQSVQFPQDPGEVLEDQINRHVPDKITLSWPESSSDAEQPAEPPPEPWTISLAFTRTISSFLGTAYTYACNMIDMHLSFWVGIGLLGLTVASAVTHRSARGRRRGKPLVLAASGIQPPHR